MTPNLRKRAEEQRLRVSGTPGRPKAVKPRVKRTTKLPAEVPLTVAVTAQWATITWPSIPGAVRAHLKIRSLSSQAVVSVKVAAGVQRAHLPAPPRGFDVFARFLNKDGLELGLGSSKFDPP